MTKHEFKEYFNHFPTGISQEIKNYATDKVFRHSRYIFTSRQGKRQYGYCTHCRKTFETDGLKHNTKAICPNCLSDCIVKASGISRRRMIDEAYFVYYEKSARDPEAIVARGIYAVRDYSGWDYSHVETQYLVRAWYVFKMGNTTMLSQSGYYSSSGTMEAYYLGECKSIFSLYGQYHNNAKCVALVTSRESIKKAVKGTPYRYSTWESYFDGDMVKFFDLYSKYPCIEYLTKLGFSGLVKDKLAGYRTYSTVNWRGKNLFQVLRINKADLKEIRSKKIHLTFLFLKYHQISKKDGSHLSPEEISKINIPGHYLDYLRTVLKYTSLRKASIYLQKQCKKQAKHFRDQEQALITWKDYIGDCIKLELNLSKERVLFPGNLYRAHQNTIKQIKIKADEELNKNIRDRIKILNEQYCFQHFGLFIRPAQSSNELIAEGKALNHCVGTYAERYAKGENILLFIRKISEPDKPYFTVEVRNKSVIQVRGFDNCNPDNLVEEFIEAFKADKLREKKTESRVRIPA